MPNPTVKNYGTTSSERYLKKICDRTFLSLWSYPCLYRKEGNFKKEVADLLVIFENHIFIFSDKDCLFKADGDLQINWNRWFKKAIAESAFQAWGAEKWIRANPRGLFLDKECSKPFPIELPNMTTAKFHLITVAHDTSNMCKKELGGSGSLMIDTMLKGLENHMKPFIIGDMNPDKSFVHVFDDTTLEIIMGTLDTISDFVSYLLKKEKLFRADRPFVFATGEEELLAYYLKQLNDKQEHDFIFPSDLEGIALEEGGWDAFKDNPQRKAQLKEDQISYMWDKLIETFSKHALQGTSYYTTSPGLQTSEKIMRFLAREPRLKRRMIARGLKEFFEKTPGDQIGRKHLLPGKDGEPYYLFLLFPYNKTENYEQNREMRRQYLYACCMVVKYKNPQLKDIIGIATEPNPLNEERSEDAIYLDARIWSENNRKEAEQLQKEFGILENPIIRFTNEIEYPKDNESSLTKKVAVLPENPRNKLCPCGSSRKYKKCHGR